MVLSWLWAVWYVAVMDMQIVNGDLTVGDLIFVRTVRDARLVGSSLTDGKVEIKCDDNWGDFILCDTNSLTGVESTYICNSHQSNLYRYFRGEYRTDWTYEDGVKKDRDLTTQSTLYLGASCSIWTDVVCHRSAPIATSTTCAAVDRNFKPTDNAACPSYRDVASEPSITINSEQPAIYHENLVVIMTCIVYGGIPKPTIQWTTLSVSRVLESPTTHWNKSSPANKPTFYTSVEFQLTKEDHNAVYSCRVTQAGFTSRTTFTTLNVEYAPRITGQENKTVDEFDDVQFECAVDSNPVSVISWYNDQGKKLPQSTTGSMYMFSKLSMTKVKPSDIGPYTCKAENSVRDTIQSRNVVSFLDVKYAPRVGGQENKTVDEFDDVQFECTVDSNPVSVITWYNNKGEIIPPPHESNATYSKLSLTNVKRSEIGSYTCRAENFVGGETKSQNVVMALYIKSKPKMCLFKQNVMIQNNSASLTCAVTGVPTPTLAWYRGTSPIHSDISDTNDTVNPYMATSVMMVSKLDTLDLKAGFVCRASNSVGETQKTVIVRTPKPCRCNKHKLKLPYKNMTAEVLQQAMEETKEELPVKTEKLTKFINKKISIPDRRASSIGLGVIGIAILVLVGTAIIVSDLLSLLVFVRGKRVKSKIKPKVDGAARNIEMQETEMHV